MRLKIDKLAYFASFITATNEHGDCRKYYEIGSSLIVCRNGLDLVSSIGLVVDAQVGWDTAQPGFTAKDENIGFTRTKITIYRKLNGGFDNTLSEVLLEN